MSRSHIEWLGRHEGLLRDISRMCAYGDSKGLKAGAMMLSSILYNRCTNNKGRITENALTIVPMPSHIGYATTMLDLCRWIRDLINHDTGIKCVKIWDGLVCDPHESSHIVKLRSGVPPKFKMYVRYKPPENGNVIIIDNTVATGATASAALEVIPNATVLAITKG